MFSVDLTPAAGCQNYFGVGLGLGLASASVSGLRRRIYVLNQSNACGGLATALASALASASASASCLLQPQSLYIRIFLHLVAFYVQSFYNRSFAVASHHPNWFFPFKSDGWWTLSKKEDNEAKSTELNEKGLDWFCVSLIDLFNFRSMSFNAIKKKSNDAYGSLWSRLSSCCTFSW